MSGLLALLDDVAAIAKVAAASLDDVIGQSTKAGIKAAGAVIDDAAVTPKYVHGFAADRELPIVGRIALGSIRNKMLILLPAALVLSAFAPQVIAPLLMLGGAYLCFEGAEKVYHLFVHPAHADEPLDEEAASALHLEQEKVWFQAAALAVVGTAITVLVYGGVALIVKADDVGLYLSRRGRLGVTRALGRGVVRGMPGFMAVLSAVGTAAMIWVGGSIVIHGLAQIGFAWPEHQIDHIAELAAHAVPQAAGLVTWAVKAALDGIIGLILGLLILPLSQYVILPLWQAIRRKPA